MAFVCVNALNGLSSFLPNAKKYFCPAELEVCQRPKRALFISTVLDSLLQP